MPYTSGFFYIQLPFVLPSMRKEIATGPDGLLWCKQEYTVGRERIVEGLDHLPLRHRLQVNQHVLTTQQIKPGERWVLEKIVLGKDAEFADGLPNLVASIDAEKEVIQTRRREHSECV